jgi:hypothetical protein
LVPRPRVAPRHCSFEPIYHESPPPKEQSHRLAHDFVLILDIPYRRPDGTSATYRRDRSAATLTAAREEDLLSVPGGDLDELLAVRKLISAARRELLARILGVQKG